MRQYTENELATAKMVIRFFNTQAGTAFRGGEVGNPENNLGITLRALEVSDIGTLKNYIKEFCRTDGEHYLQDCMRSFLQSGDAPTPAPAPMPVREQEVQYSMGILEKAVVQLISNTQAAKVEAEIMGRVTTMIQSYIESEYGPIERKISTVVDGRKVEVEGVQHAKFETVLKFVANDEPVFLTGPAGSGKNVLCKHVAQALGLNFYFTNAVTQEYKLTGFTDAMGNYQPTQFYKAFTEGGLFMLDEMDASIPEVLVILNAAIANRYFDFPAPIGYKEAHPDFRIIAAGNTIGKGADYEYVGRNQLDAASLDRFAVVKMDYDERIENAVAGNDELAQFCRDFRRAAKEAGQQVVVSYRGIGRLAKMLQIMTTEEALETCLIKGMEKDDLQVITSSLPEGKYLEAVKKIIRSM